MDLIESSYKFDNFLELFHDDMSFYLAGDVSDKHNSVMLSFNLLTCS